MFQGRSLHALGLLLVLAVTARVAEAGETSFRRYEEAQRRLERQAYMDVMATPPPSCYIEHGFDYVGYDMGNKPSATPEGCCGICHQTEGCRAYSWSMFNGGTCWLKNGRDEIVYNPNVDSALLNYGDNPVCEAQAGTDFQDHDLDRVDGKTFADCCDKCHKYPGCRAYSWSNFNGGSCWLKSSADTRIANPEVTSAQAYPAYRLDNQCMNPLEKDTDYVGNDIGSATSPTPSGCCPICQSNPNCRAFAWSGFNGGTCWLKSRKGEVIAKTGVIASWVRPNLECALTADTDFEDNNIGNVPATDPMLCCDACKAFGGCKAFAWSNYKGGTCWLKSKAGKASSMKGVSVGTI